MNNLINHI